MAQRTQTAINPIMPCAPSDANIAETLSTTLIPLGMNGMLPRPSTSIMIASAARLTPTSASAPAHAFTLFSISMIYLLSLPILADRVLFKTKSHQRKTLIKLDNLYFNG